VHSFQRRSPQVDFAKVVVNTASDLRVSPEALFLTGAAFRSPQVSREAREVRNTLKALQQDGVERSVLKLAFFWHEEVADLFPHLVEETFAQAGVYAPNFVRDITERAQNVAVALGSPFAAVDLLCSRFTRNMAPIHVDYGEYVVARGPELKAEHVRALSFVMPYVGKGTEYLVHSRDLVEGPLMEGIQRHNNTVLGINEEFEGCPEAARAGWVSTPSDSFAFHRNGLCLHRAPSSSDFRLLLAIDACLPPEKVARPLDTLRETLMRNISRIRGHRSLLR
jgi:hypothetical protein